MMSVWIAVDIWMIVAVIIDWMPAFTRTGVPMIVRPSVEKWIIPPVPDPAWAIKGRGSPRTERWWITTYPRLAYASFE